MKYRTLIQKSQHNEETLIIFREAFFEGDWYIVGVSVASFVMSRVQQYDLSEEQFRKDRAYGILRDLMYINHSILWMDDKTIKEFERLSK